MQTLDASMEHAMWVERGATVLAKRSRAPGVSSGEKHPVQDNGGQTSRQRPLDLYDFILRVVGFRGDRGLVDSDSSGNHNSSIRGDRIVVLFVEDLTHRSSASRARADVINVGSLGIICQLAREQDSLMGSIKDWRLSGAS